MTEPILARVSLHDRKRYALIKQHGLCRGLGPAIFFNDEDYGIARRLCEGCQVRGMCLDLALTYHEKGMWAGTSERDRARLRRQRRRLALSA